MQCYDVKLRTVKYFNILCILLLFVNNVVTQLVPNQGSGLPLPIFREVQTQGQTNVPATRNGNNNFNPPFIVKLDDDDSVGNPIHSFPIGGNAVSHFPAPRGGPGSLQHIPEPSQDASVQDLIKHPAVLKKIQKETSSDSAVKIDSVITAHTQVVSGQIVYLDLRIVKTKCSIGTENIAACEVDVTEDPYICEVAVWRRPWLNSTKVIDEKSRCAEVESDTTFKNWNKGNDVMRDTKDAISLQGLPNYLDEHQVALEAFDYVNRGSESKFKGQMVQYHIGTVKHDPTTNITAINVKVDYGFTLCLTFPNRKVDGRTCPVDVERENYVCSVTVVSDPNLTTNLKVEPNDDDDIDCEKKHSVEEELVVPVKAVCMGCPQPVSLNDPSVLRIAEFAVVEYDRTSDEKELHTILKIHKAQTQVVNGIKYYLTLELADTDCRKPLSAFNLNRTLCNQDLTDEADICELVILEQPWQKALELVSARCFDKTDYPNAHRDEFIVPVVGGSLNSPAVGFVAASSLLPSDLHATAGPGNSAVDLDSDPWKPTIDFIVREFNKREMDDNDDGFYKVMSVLEATTSEEAEGQVDHLVVELGETVCTRRRTSNNCPFKNDEDTEICEASVLKGNPNTLLALRCDERDDDHYRLTANPFITPYQPLRQPFFFVEEKLLGAPGGPIEQPTNDSNILNIARFVVDQYNLQSDEDELFKLSRIINSYSQLAGNVIYVLELELQETECKKYQPVDDVTKCPEETREEAEICQAEVSVGVTAEGKEAKRLTRIFCDDRKDFYVKMMKHINEMSAQEGGGWKPEETSSDKMNLFGDLIADEFDFRSDEENIFVLVKVLAAKTEESGLTHLMKVELAETVCPKYKERINKTRCAIDIGEEHKICDAIVTERPWKGQHEVSKLGCFERDDSKEEDDSREVLYPRVHPSAHARPKFLQSRFRVRQYSHESDESNEKYYGPGPGSGSRNLEKRRQIDSDEDRDRDDDDDHVLASIRMETTAQRYDDDNDDDTDDDKDDDDNRDLMNGRGRHLDTDNDDDKYIDRDNDDDDKRDNNSDKDKDSDDRDRYREIRGDDDDDKDSDLHPDKDSRSTERRSLFRVRRAVDEEKKTGGSSLMLGAFNSVAVDDPKVKELSTFALNQMDRASDNPQWRRVEEVVEARRKVVAGWLWSLTLRVSHTQCPKNTEAVGAPDLSTCQIDENKPRYICHITVWEKPWESFRKVDESKCAPEDSSNS